MKAAQALMQNVKFSVMVKAVFIAILIVILGIPLLMIGAIVDDRQTRRAEAEREVFSSWGGPQTVAGPVLAVPYLVNGGRSMHYVLPDSLTITAAVQPEERYRSIYEVIVYRGTCTLAAQFPAVMPEEADEVLWDEAELLIGLTDIRGIRENMRVQWDGGESVFEPAQRQRFARALAGTPDDGQAGEQEWRPYRQRYGEEAAAAVLRAPLALAGPPAEKLMLSATVAVNGSRRLLFLPLGRETRVSMQSPWADPSFCGAFLPATRTVRTDGFDALWQVFHLSRPFPQQWEEGTMDGIGAGRSAFGVEFIRPVDNYQRATRAIKYGMMFIVLTFTAFFLFEMLQGLRIHFIQYLLVGCALCLFYLLLLSLSEHVGFNTAYGAATAGIVLLISGYCWAVLRTFRRALLMALITGVLYGYLFVLLQLQDYALLCGSLGLFVILALIMYLTRNINWYAPTADAETPRE